MLVLLMYAPAIIYLVWSWRLLRAHSTHASDGANNTRWHLVDVSIRILLMSLVAGFLWFVAVQAFATFGVLLTYNLQGNELEVAQFFVAVSLLPTTILSWVVDRLPTSAVPSAWHLALIAGVLASLLLTGSMIEWLLIRLSNFGV
jgi:hypothetical protein